MHNSLPHAHSWWASTLTIFSFTMFSISVARSVVLPSAAFRDTLEDCGGRRCVKHPHPQARMPTCISTGTASPNTPSRLSDASAFVNHLPPSPPILSPDLHYHQLSCISTRNSLILLCNIIHPSWYHSWWYWASNLALHTKLTFLSTLSKGVYIPTFCTRKYNQNLRSQNNRAKIPLLLFNTPTLRETIAVAAMFWNIINLTVYTASTGTQDDHTELVCTISKHQQNIDLGQEWLTSLCQLRSPIGFFILFVFINLVNSDDQILLFA